MPGDHLQCQQSSAYTTHSIVITDYAGTYLKLRVVTDILGKATSPIWSWWHCSDVRKRYLTRNKMGAWHSHPGFGSTPWSSLTPSGTRLKARSPMGSDRRIFKMPLGAAIMKFGHLLSDPQDWPRITMVPMQLRRGEHRSTKKPMSTIQMNDLYHWLKIRSKALTFMAIAGDSVYLGIPLQNVLFASLLLADVILNAEASHLKKT